MLTVKFKSPCGTEVIYETSECRYTPGEKASGNVQTDTPETLWIDSGPLTVGVAFVMNESGKTISRYDLAGWATSPLV